MTMAMRARDHVCDYTAVTGTTMTTITMDTTSIFTTANQACALRKPLHYHLVHTVEHTQAR